MDLALNNLEMLICHKTQQTKPNQTNFGGYTIRPGNQKYTYFNNTNN